MTEHDYDLLDDIANQFCRDLAEITAKALRPFDVNVRDEVRSLLQDRTSLFSPFTYELTEKKLTE